MSVAFDLNIPEKFTAQEVCAILCDGCRLKIPDTFNMGTTFHGSWKNNINHTNIPCFASEWRRKVAELNLAEKDREEKRKCEIDTGLISARDFLVADGH